MHYGTILGTARQIPSNQFGNVSAESGRAHPYKNQDLLPSESHKSLVQKRIKKSKKVSDASRHTNIAIVKQGSSIVTTPRSVSQSPNKVRFRNDLGGQSTKRDMTPPGG